MEFVIVGWPPNGPKLELDWRQFPYAGKFVMTSTGKGVARDDGEIVGAIAFNEDRTDEQRAWIRYVTMRNDRRGEEIGPQLTAAVAARLLERYETVRTGANNPFSYQSFYKAGFGFTGETTGMAELVLDRPGDRSVERYQAGLRRFAERDLSDDEDAFIASHLDADPPALLDVQKAED